MALGLIIFLLYRFLSLAFIALFLFIAVGSGQFLGSPPKKRGPTTASS
jgi:hypothetical protein